MIPDREPRTVCIDLDLTLWTCTDRMDVRTYTALPGAVEATHALRKAGWFIVLHTGRHTNWWMETQAALKQLGFAYDLVQFNKPPAMYYIDDKALKFTGDWPALVSEIGAADVRD
jgi:hypothetical protein